MLTRRQVLGHCAAIPPAACLSGVMAPFGAGVANTAVLSLERFVFDARFSEAFDIGQHVADFGIPLSPTADDLMDLWYDELDLLWRERPMALAGVTMTEALFVLETLAMDRQMRVVYRGQHGVVEHGRIAHELAGPKSVVDWLGALPPAADWERELAAAMTECPLGSPEAARVEFRTEAPGLAVRDVPLVSWIIAPRSEVAIILPS